MASKKRRYMDALEQLSDGSSESTEGDGEAEQESKPSNLEMTMEQLERCGYKGTRSLLLIPEPQQEVQQDLRWSDGRAHQAREEECIEDREKTRHAATQGVEAQAQFSEKSIEQREKLRVHRKEERAELATEHKLTFKQKEKRKREAGQAKSSKNFVEEEKRVARDFGVYSCFD